MDAESRLRRYQDAVRATDALIESAYAPGDTSLAAITARAAHRMERVRSLLRDLGDPFASIPLIHIGGTSGKGSTSAFVTAILTAAGYRTGLHTSPYLQVATEKLQIGDRLVDPDRFAGLVEEVLEVATAWSARHEERLTYGEIWIGLVGAFFRIEEVELGVIEVGAGGRFDLTNVITPRLSIITSVGFDHIQTLGNTIESIAWHKAGIIKPGAPVVTAVDDPVALELILQEARSQGSAVTRVIEGETFTIEEASAGAVSWREHDTGQRFSTKLPGRFQARNGATAVAAARQLRALGFAIPDEAIAAGIARTRFPGRAEVMQRRPLVMLDGAHNPQKVAALARDLETLLPVAPGGRRIALLGMLDAKAHADSIDTLLPRIDMIIATSPHVLAKQGLAAEQLAQVARDRGFSGPIHVEPEPRAALDRTLQIAEPADAIIVTGSLYLVGNLRGFWQPDDEIVLARTPWPRT